LEVSSQGIFKRHARSETWHADYYSKNGNRLDEVENVGIARKKIIE